MRDYDEILDEWRAIASEVEADSVGISARRVRSLGDRRGHRRRLVSGVVAAALAIALVGAVATLAGNGIGQSPTPARPAALPTDLDLTRGAPVDEITELTEGPGEELVLRRFSPCDPRAHAELAQLPQDWVLIDSDTRPSQLRGVHYQSGNLDQVRLVQLYRDGATAERVMQQVRDAVASCPSLERGGPNGTVDRSDFDLVEIDAGDEGVLVTSRWFAGDEGAKAVPGVELRYIVRVGPVIVLVSELNRRVNDSVSEAKLAAELQRTAEALVAELCLFADDQC